MDQYVTRRSVLRAGGAMGLLPVTGCSDGDSTSDETGVDQAGVDETSSERTESDDTGSDETPSNETGSDETRSESWPMFQCDPEHTGHASGTSGPGENLVRRWKRDAASLAAEVYDTVDTAHLSLPVATVDSVYALLWGGERNEATGFGLVILNGETGDIEQFREIPDMKPLSGEHLSRPAVVDGTVYVTVTPPHSVDPVVALDGDSDAITWRDESDRSPVTGPTVRDGQVIAGAGSSGTAFALGDDGTPAWRFEGEMGDFTATSRARNPPTVSQDRVYVPTNGPLFALGRDGTEHWTRDLRFENALIDQVTQPYTPVLGDDLYVVTGSRFRGGDGRLLALDPSDGSTKWTFRPSVDDDRRRDLAREYYEATARKPRLGVGVYGTPALRNGTLYVPGLEMPDEDGMQSVPHCYAVDAETGEERWKARLSPPLNRTPPVVADGVVYLAAAGAFVAIDAESGDVVATLDTETSYTGIAVSSDAVYVGDRETLCGIGP